MFGGSAQFFGQKTLFKKKILGGCINPISEDEGERPIIDDDTFN